MPETADEGTLRFAGDQFRDCISLQDVSVAYPRGVALENLNMELPSGNMTAVVGPSGSGKTTFVDTLLRLHAPSQGQIAVDGRPLDAFTLTSWRRNIGYVSQDSALLDATIADNIRLGVPDAPIDDVEAAAKLAGADAFIREMPDGYETVVGDRGLRLSGGQRQRIALASALLPDPAILILDEATSALDSPTEAAVMEAVDAMRGDRTIVIVAHRLSTVKKADKIYVLQKGRVAEAGTWDELVDADGLFAEMWKYQQKSPEP
jgi:ATP-binding cassette subfamily B protein